jgi:alpha-glucosidase
MPRLRLALFCLVSVSLNIVWTGCSDLPASSNHAAELSLDSPDKRLRLKVLPGQVLMYSIELDGKEMVRPSRLGLRVERAGELGNEALVLREHRSSHNSTWNNRFGKRSLVRNHYDELTLQLRPRSGGADFQVVFRAYDDGIAFRYVLPDQPEEWVIAGEQTEFGFPKDCLCFAGQQENGFQGAQEWEFKRSHLSAIKPGATVGLPLLVQTPAGWIAIAESDLRDWAGMWLEGASEPRSGAAVVLKAKLAPRKDGRGAVVAHARQASPWRAFIIGTKPGDLIESDLVSNLAAPAALPDNSWVHPGKMAWDHWWSGDVQMDTPTLKSYIQLAADMGWPYQLIDWQWYGAFNKPEADITRVNPAVDMEEVRRFAKERGVKLWVWLYWSDVDRNDAYKRAFALYERWGVAGVKIDFMDRDDQEMVRWYEKITRAAAGHHLMVNFHGAFKTSGFNRTYPNQITREGILGNEYNRWSRRVTPEHKLTLPFTRFLAGPADFTPGGFLNRQPEQFQPSKTRACVQGTRAAELALFVLYDSPLGCICDAPENYKHQPGSDFLRIVPTVWDDTRVLEGAVGEHLVMARRSGPAWFLGGMTVEPRQTDLKLGFLPAGKWKLRLWRDAADSDANAEHITTEERTVHSEDSLRIPMARSGGFTGWLRRE